MVLFRIYRAPLFVFKKSQVIKMKAIQCEFCRFNTEVLAQIKGGLPDSDTVLRLSEVFKVFGDGTRIKILWTLFDNEKCVYDVAEEISMTQSAVSHQLRVLKEARLIKARREGKNTFYSLDDEHVKRIIEQVMIHINE